MSYFSIFFLTLILSYLFLHQITFNINKTTSILSNKLTNTTEKINIIKNTYKLLPFFLKQGILLWDNNRIDFENGSKINSISSRIKKYEGIDDFDDLYINDFAYIPNIENIYKDIMPKIVSKNNSKCIIHSCPNGNNFFTDLLYKSELPEGDPDKNSFKTIRTYWWEVEGRDSKWKENEIKMIGLDNFREQYDLQFIDKHRKF